MKDLPECILRLPNSVGKRCRYKNSVIQQIRPTDIKTVLSNRYSHVTQHIHPTDIKTVLSNRYPTDIQILLSNRHVSTDTPNRYVTQQICNLTYVTQHIYPTYISVCCPTYIHVTHGTWRPIDTGDRYRILPNIYTMLPNIYTPIFRCYPILGSNICWITLLYMLGVYVLGNIPVG